MRSADPPPPGVSNPVKSQPWNARAATVIGTYASANNATATSKRQTTSLRKAQFGRGRGTSPVSPAVAAAAPTATASQPSRRRHAASGAFGRGSPGGTIVGGDRRQASSVAQSAQREPTGLAPAPYRGSRGPAQSGHEVVRSTASASHAPRTTSSSVR
jgi:hypothetical protein